MKKTIIFIVFIFYQIQTVMPQQVYSGKIYYTIRLIKPKLSDIESQESRTKVSQLINNTSKVEAVIYFKGAEAIYMVLDNMDNDANKDINLTKILAGNNDIYYYNLLHNELVKQTEALGESFIVELKKPDWKITQQTKIIGGYNCFMAIDESSKNKKAKPIAWFTNQLPVSFGPKEFVGLPGLVIEVETTSFIISLKNIKLNPENDIKIKKPKKGKKISYKEYTEILRKSVPALFSK